MIIGKFTDGFLETLEINEIVHRHTSEDGEIFEKVETIEEQVERLAPDWKPVEQIDDTKMSCEEENCFIFPVPYDAGETIAYRYEKRFDKQKVKAEIQAYKDLLSGSDYKVTKCYEASLLGQPLPYDIASLHDERQQYRDKINEFESIMQENRP